MSIPTLESPALDAIEEARSSHVRWSELNGEFLDHVAENPEYLERATFASLEEPWRQAFPSQPWPFFVDAEQQAELVRVGLGMDRLMKATLERFLTGDIARVRDFYPFSDGGEWQPRRTIFSNPAIFPRLISGPTGISAAPSRGDYTEGEDGLKCMEYNAGGRLGVMQLDGIGELYLECPPIARFLEEKGRTARAPDTITAQFRHMVQDTIGLGVWSGGDFNVAVVVRPNDGYYGDMFVDWRYNASLRQALDERGIAGGRAILCGPEDFRDEADGMYVGDHRVHLVLEHHDGTGRMLPQLRAFKDGRLNLVSGPLGFVLSDKGNIAYLSENAGSDEFTAAERAFIERHVPWTRRVQPGLTGFRGRGFRVPDDLADRREEFVLKKACSIGGHAVLVGRFRTDAEWREDLARAVAERDWVVQEYIAPRPYCFQAGERGAVRHDMVWGLFVFGEHYGGSLLRSMPRTGTGGVVNAERGALCGVGLEVIG
jgi:hypothetical protein